MILRFRAFLIGAALCATIGTSAIYANTIIRGSFVAWCFSNPIALFFFFYLVLGNILVGLAARRLSLRREELVLIFAMMFVSASLPTFGLVEHLLPMITGVYYYATPENGWVDLIQPLVPGWIAPSEESLILGFYEGLPQGESIPWGGWMESLSAWLLFLLSLHLVSICLMVVLRKQWIQGERLLYPMMQAPIELVASGPESGPMSSIPPLLRRSLFWIGFALPVVIGSINGLSHYSPYFRGIGLSTGFTILGVSVPMQVSFSLLGFSYFISQPLGLGIWVFYLLTILERGVFNTLGIASTEKLGWFSNPQAPYLTHQALGAMLMFALFTLWKARNHLRQVVRKAFTGDPGIDDSSEIVSYRGAVFGIAGGLVVMTVWLNAAGIPLWVVPLFLAVAFLLFIALSRIVVEAGVALVRAPLIAPDFIMASMGVSRLGGSGLTGLAYCYPWTADIVTFPMASCANNLKLIEETVAGPQRRPFFWAMMGGILVTLLSSFWIVIYLSYSYGGINLHDWWWRASSEFPLTYLAQMLNSQATTDFWGWMFTFFGAGMMWILMICQLRFVSWPLHPLGLAMGGTVFTSGVMWFNVFLAWLIKGWVLKYGGSAAYKSLRSFFLGMILGAFVVSGTWLVIDHFTGMTNNFVLGWQ
ncbi:MAG: hypothetical protein OXH50_04805 [Gemmatimonadetes bacterium]|nr:hypothetical protein [Gemmatimonadota bacterium]